MTPTRLTALLLLTCLAAPPALAAEGRVVTLYDVRRAEAPPTIDGKLDDPCWQGKPAITNMVLRGGHDKDQPRIPARHQTQTTVVYDDKALYVGIRMAEPDIDKLRKHIAKYDGQLWWDDSVELYIETGSSHKEYFKFMSNPLGTRHDMRGKDTPMGFKMFDFGTGAEWTVKAHEGKDYWSLEFRFPWSDFEVNPPKPGDVWTFEIVRFRYADNYEKSAREGEYSCWNVGSHHRNPASFGNIVFGGSTSELETILAEKILPVVNEPIVIYGAHGEIRYTDYGRLKAAKLQEARSAVDELRRRLEPIAASIPEKVLAALNKDIAALEDHVKSLADGPAGPASAEALEKAVARARGLEWTVRYHQLNAELPAADKVGK